MDRARLAELHYVTAIENLPSICEHGILSHDSAAALPHVDLSSQRMQERRKNKVVAYAGQERPRKLHSYANLFVHGRNSMLRFLCHAHGHHALAVMAVSTDVLELAGVVMADQNAATNYVRFYSSPSGLLHLREDYVLARHWGDPAIDQIDYWRRKPRRSAEVLVPDRVEPGYLRCTYVSCRSSYERCRRLGVALEVVVDADLFFQ